MGAADSRPAAAALLRQRAAGRDGRRLAGLLRGVLRHHRRAGLRLARRGRLPGRRSSGTCPRCCRSRSRRLLPPEADAVMIRVVLPAHLRRLASVQGEVRLDVAGPGHPGHRARRARGQVPHAPRHDPRPGQPPPAGLHPLLRLRGRPVPRAARRARCPTPLPAGTSPTSSSEPWPADRSEAGLARSGAAARRTRSWHCGWRTWRAARNARTLPATLRLAWRARCDAVLGSPA